MRRTAVLIAVVGGALLACCLSLTWLAWSTEQPLSPYAVTNPVIGVGYLVPSVVIGWHRPRNLLVFVLAVGAAGHLLAGIGFGGYFWGSAAGWPSWSLTLCMQLMGVAWKLGLGPPFALLLLLFPDGRLPSPRWRWLVWATFAALFIGVVGWITAPDSYVVNTVVQVADLTVTVAAIVSLVQRYRGGTEQIRGQILWLVLAVLVILVLNMQRAITGQGPELLLLSFVCVPVAITIAIVRYQLLDIRLVVSRAVLYGALIAIVLAGYVALVALTAVLLPVDLSRWGPVASAIVVALALNPVRVGLQRIVTRAFYGRRAEPQAAVALIGARLGEADDLAEVLETARVSLRLPALTIRGLAGNIVAATGTVPDVGSRESIPLTSRGRGLGVLEVSLRTGEMHLHPKDAAAIAVLAGPLALLLREQALAEELRRSRTQVVQARESERSLLHRDLHDGLGPTLTNAVLRADAAANRLESDPTGAAALLRETRAGIRDALGDVRRVVYGLRPLALEELGLVGAIEEQAARAGRLPVRVSAAPDTFQVSPAVELAAYRIVCEAITNAQRHSIGTEVDVRLTVEDGELQVVIHDDGSPAEGWIPGVGLRSVSERAEELGGRAEIRTGTDGWWVTAWIPCGLRRAGTLASIL